MIVKKAISTSLIALSLSSITMLAQAGDLDLIIGNFTDKDSTCVINDSACSTILGADGITKAGDHAHHINENVIKYAACLGNWENCKADVYMTNNCTGPKIATVIFDVNKGVKSITMASASYKIAASGFTVNISGV